ncbi:DUF916 and DUF3324 domain-containing protein [Carnobacterium divergens]|uniref:DUF916 and DUF3324 domain-containing protein n=1 Tax=Carnobacterium divergens TaxID=2748 RepID=A0AAW8R6T6_CARDV|nr:DUF916 and DUF3324 domain-containing protein [Carnobacterium divergens]MDT1957043.1 DUF916 and DUF3324 domain-containing protein [Carnobacterium divergens]MDT1973013.1 DUF916 and DUF3324 domain-containing protein [Carnobacterium divergens]MDT2012683.1 DUF916 and DUF3324 domain-containing protein [Carnobacterium divergens]
MTKKIICLLLLLPTIRYADTVKAAELNFNVEPVPAENQMDKTKTYFDLKTEPNMKETIKINVYNHSNQDIIVEPSVHTATTNLNGVVEYGKSLTKPNSTIPYHMEQLVKPITKELTIPKNGQNELQLQIDMPSKEFEGILAGGISIKEKKSDQNLDSKDKGMAVENEYVYISAIVLHGKNQNIPEKLELTNVAPNQVNYRNVIDLSLKNSTSQYINQLSIEAQVFKKGSSKSLYTSKKEKMQMAPDSNFNYPIDLKGDKLKPGQYTVKVNASSKEQTWQFSKEFNVTAKKANQLNNRDVSIKENHQWIYYLIGSILVVIALGSLFFVYKKRMTTKQLEISKLKEQLLEKEASKNNKSKLIK